MYKCIECGGDGWRFHSNGQGERPCYDCKQTGKVNAEKHIKQCKTYHKIPEVDKIRDEKINQILEHKTLGS